MNDAYRDARGKLLRVIVRYGVIALAPLILSAAMGIWFYGPRAHPSPYVMIPVFIWGACWLSVMLNYVRSHPLPPPN
jgi:hypothetical protein